MKRKMKNICQKYLGFLKIEFEDLEKDFETMKETCEERERKREITEYVCLENLCVLQRVFTSVKQIVDSLDQIFIERYKNLDEMIVDVDSMFRKKLKQMDFIN